MKKILPGRHLDELVRVDESWQGGVKENCASGGPHNLKHIFNLIHYDNIKKLKKYPEDKRIGLLCDLDVVQRV